MTRQPDDAATDLLMREVDEELRHEQMNKLWKKYGKYAIGAAVAVVLAVAGAQGWTVYKKSTQETASSHYGAAIAMADQGRSDDAILALTKLAQDGTDGYALLAEMRRAALLQEKGDVAAALSSYEALGQKNIAVYSDLARLRAAYLVLDTDNADRAVQLVSAMDNDKNAFRSSAREVLALAALKKGEQAKAFDYYTRISQDAGAPQGMRNRATELLAVLSK